jgi:hypothetical protein
VHGHGLNEHISGRLARYSRLAAQAAELFNEHGVFRHAAANSAIIERRVLRNELRAQAYTIPDQVICVPSVMVHHLIN